MNPADLRDWLTFWQRPRASPAALRRFQDRRLRRLVHHAWERVPFYRRRLEACGVRPGQVREAADLAGIPVLCKSDLLDASLEDLVADGADIASCVMHGTSGTSAEPLRLVRTPAEERTLFAYRLRAQVLSGLRPWHTRIKVGSAPVQLWPHRIGLFRCANLADDLPLAEILRRLEQRRPSVLYAGPTMFELLLETVEESRLRALGPHLIFSGAELLNRNTRARLREVFGCPVVDFYGSVEVNLIAWECRGCGLYHTCDDSVFVEVLREDGSPAGPGEEGRLVMTALHSFAMPLIRYEVGDVVRRPASAPPCRIGFGSIDRILGRVADYIPLPNGAWLSSHRIEEVTDEVPGIRRFQCVQTGPAEIVFKVQPGKGFGEDSVRRLRQNFVPMLPAGMRLEIKVVEEMELTPAGKLRVVQAWRPPTSEGAEASAAQAGIPPAGQDR